MITIRLLDEEFVVTWCKTSEIIFSRVSIGSPNGNHNNSNNNNGRVHHEAVDVFRASNLLLNSNSLNRTVYRHNVSILSLLHYDLDAADQGHKSPFCQSKKGEERKQNKKMPTRFLV